MPHPGAHRGYLPRKRGLYGSTRPGRPFYEHMFEESLVSSDFTEPTGPKQVEGVQAVVAGAGANVFGSITEDLSDHPGVWILSTGTTATGRVFLISGSNTGWHLGRGGITRVGTWLKIGPNLSTGAQRYTLRAGLFSIALPNVVVNGVGFEYDDSQNGGRWQAITHDGVETSTDTGITVAADTWYYLEAEINSDGTSVDFLIDNVLVATNTTNIPLGTGFRMFYNTHIMKLIGTTARTAVIDAYYVYQRVDR